LGSVDLLKRLNIDIIDDVLCLYTLLARQTTLDADILEKTLKILAISFKDLVVVSEKSIMMAKFVALLHK